MTPSVYASTAVVIVTAIYFACLGVGAFAAPARVRRFLLGFAGSPGAHYLEMGLRIVVGGAFVLAAASLRFPQVFAAVGWVVLLTTAVLLFVPWRLHRRFAAYAVPQALEYLPLLGVSSLAVAGFLLYGVFAAPPAGPA